MWGRAAYRSFKREIGKLEVFNYGEERINTEKKREEDTRIVRMSKSVLKNPISVNLPYIIYNTHESEYKYTHINGNFSPGLAMLPSRLIDHQSHF